jgi:mannan endo-1,4-beta-mannosidase
MCLSAVAFQTADAGKRTGIVNRTSTITGTRLAQDPTIAAWETGNELKNPPVEWTDAISTLIKSLAPSQLVVDGTYGIKRDALKLLNVDI